jgi:hypothetical protein
VVQPSEIPKIVTPLHVSNPTRAPFPLTQRGAQPCAGNPTRVGWSIPQKYDDVQGLFQTPRAWGGAKGKAAVANCSSISDPTRVGWSSTGLRLAATRATLTFQTPRAWGGDYLHYQWMLSRTFRPHARGVEQDLRVWKSKASVSDPTRVGWSLSAHYLYGGVEFQTPRAWGGAVAVNGHFKAL